MDDSVTEHDEVVLIPPVSGGDQQATTFSALDLMAFLPAAVAVVAILANTQGQEIWAAVLVLIVAIWALDIGTAFAARGREFASLAVVVTAAGSAMAAHVAGGGGYALALVIAAVVSLGWAVAFPEYRQVEVFSPTVMVSLLGGLGTASLVLARSAHTPRGECGRCLPRLRDRRRGAQRELSSGSTRYPSSTPSRSPLSGPFWPLSPPH